MIISRIITCIASAVLFTGCLSKNITVTSTPPGAVLSINDVEIGPTPVTTEWHGGGLYRFALIHKDKAPLKKTIRITYRWYSYPLIDMGADFMTTKDIQDNKVLHFDLQNAPKENVQDALTRAKSMRDEIK